METSRNTSFLFFLKVFSHIDFSYSLLFLVAFMSMFPDSLFCVWVCACVHVCARPRDACASLTLHNPAELLFPDSRRTIRRAAGLEQQKRKCDLHLKKKASFGLRRPSVPGGSSCVSVGVFFFCSRISAVAHRPAWI